VGRQTAVPGARAGEAAGNTASSATTEAAGAGGVAVVKVREAAPVQPAPPGGEDGDDERADRYGRIAISLTVLAFGLHLLSVVLRGAAAQRVPWGNMYEFSATAALAVMAVFLMLLVRRDARWMGIFVVGLVLFTLAIAVLVLYADAGQLMPALRSYWLVIHVAAAIVSSGVFTVAGIASLLFLVKERQERRLATGREPGRGAALLARVPGTAVLDRTAYRLVAFAFPLWTFAVIAGAIWAENAWGRYWGWDPKETWAFITWVVYAAYLHARATAGWKGRNAAWIALLGLAAFLFNYFGVNIFFTGFHSYAGIG
jgi:cytochrome c-type biogenesis protein CcsB